MTLVISFDDYLAENGAGRFASDVATNRLPNTSENQRARIADQQYKIIQDNARNREMLKIEYNELVASGEIRPPSRIELLIKTAQGNPDNLSVQAARRILEKQNIQWERAK